MDLKNAKLNVKATCGEKFFLTGTRPVFEYRDGKRVGDPIAYSYTVVLPDRRYEQIQVRIDGACQLEVSDEPIPVNLVGLELSIKWSKTLGNYIAGAATGISIAR